MNKKTTKLMATALTATMGAGIATQLVQAAEVTPYEAALEAVITMEKDPSGANIDKAYNAVVALKAGAQKDALNKRVEAVAAPHHKAVYDIMVTARTNKDLKTIGDARKAVAGMAKIFIKDAYTWSSELDNFTIEYQKTVVDTLNAIADGKKEVKQTTINELREIIVGLELQRSNEGLLKLVLDYSATLDKVQMDYVNVVLAEVNAATTDAELAVAKAKYNDLLTMKDEALKAAVQSNIGAAIATKEAELAIPRVESAKAVNAKQLKITFNKPVSASTVINSADNKIKNITFKETTSSSDVVDSTNATGALSSDKKTLTITLGGSETFEGTYSVVVSKDVKTTANESVQDFSTTFSIQDRIAPEIVSVSATTNTNVATTATVKFSEPVSAAVVKIDGVAYSGTGTGTSELSFSGLALDASKSHTVEVLNATDAKNNVKALQNTTFTVTKDTVAPAVQFETIGDHQILLTFDKAMNTSSVNTSSVKIVDEKLTSLLVSEYSITAINSKMFLVDVSKALYGNGETSRTLTVQINDQVKDSLGNKIAVTTKNVGLTKDVVAPKVSDVSVVYDKDGNAEKLQVKFNEELNAAPANLSGISAKNAVSGVDEVVGDLLDATTIKLLSDGQTVEIGVKPAALSKKVNFVFAKGFVVDTAQTANDSVAFSKSVEFKAASSAFKIVQSDLNVTTANTIVVDYGRAIVGDFGVNAANNPANYTIAGKTLPLDTQITVDTNLEQVTIVLPEEFVANTDTNAVLTVNNVKDIYGRTIAPFVGYANVKDNTTPKLNKVVWNTNGSFTLDFSEAITTATSAGTESGVEVKLNDGTYTLTTANYGFAAGTGSDDGNIVVTLKPSDDATHGKYIDVNGNSAYDAGTDVLVADIMNVSVKVKDANGIKDAAGNDAKSGIVVSAVK